MTEFEKLVQLMDEASIPYERDDDSTLYVNCFGLANIKRIKYPKKGVDEVCSVVYGYGTYGYPEGLLEICGLLTDEEAKYDSVAGHLTAEDVFSRIKSDYEKKIASVLSAIPESFIIDIDNEDGSATHLYYPQAFEAAIESLEQGHCEDVIGRAWLKEAIHNFYYGLTHIPTEEDIQAYIDAAPSVTPKARVGHWIRITKGAMKEKYICSECGRQIEDDGIEGLLPIKYPYCHCGAKMTESEEE